MEEGEVRDVSEAKTEKLGQRFLPFPRGQSIQSSPRTRRHIAELRATLEPWGEGRRLPHRYLGSIREGGCRAGG